MPHSALTIVIVIDVLGLGFLLHAAWVASLTLTHWNPAVSTRRQIDLEGKYETASFGMYWTLILGFASIVLLIVAISNILPGLVSGAMCGTGVMQAAGSFGWRALLFRLVALMVIYAWSAVNGVSRNIPSLPPRNSRLVLAALPFQVLGFWDTLRFMAHLDVRTPVDCCTVVYNQFRTARSANMFMGVPEQTWGYLFLALTLVFLLICIAALVIGKPHFRLLQFVVFTGAVWVLCASVYEVRVLSAYIYEILHHHCPWCLFLPEHHHIGFALFAVLAWMVMELAAIPAVVGTGRFCRQLESASLRRAKRAIRVILLLQVGFALLAFVPALLWRFRFGVWLG